jgi:uncharacterized protein (TIRG00374 family)
MKNRRWIAWIVIALVLALIAWKLHTSHFDWAGFWLSCRRADWRLLLAAVAVIYTNCIFRAARWAIFLRPALPPEKRVHWYALLGSQFIGFAGLAIFGRIGELIRPYLVARRTGLNFPSQVAVVAVERIFDLAAFAIIFSLNLILAPNLNTLPYHERFHTIGLAVAALTAIIAGFVIAVRLAGGLVASAFRSFFGLFSKPLGESVAAKVIHFREGLNTIDSARDFLLAALNSLLLWTSIAISYILVMRAFPAPVSSLTISHVILLMGFSVVGSVVQLPGVGGGAQALTIGALTLLFGIPRELAFSAGLILWVVTSMSIIPGGLIYARIEQVSLGKITQESEAAGHQEEAAVQ